MPLVRPYAAKFAAHFVIVEKFRAVSIYEKSKGQLTPDFFVSETAGNFSRISRPPRHYTSPRRLRLPHVVGTACLSLIARV